VNEKHPNDVRNIIPVDEAQEQIRREKTHRAKKAQHAINSFKGILPELTRKRLAKNLGKIIAEAKQKGVSKGEIVVRSGVRPGTDDKLAVNALNSYCILPVPDPDPERKTEIKRKREAPPRLTARPQNYLKLALAAADLMGMKRYEVISMLVENTNKFEGDRNLDDDTFSPAETVLSSLMIKLSLLKTKYRLADYFREVEDFSATYNLDWQNMQYGWMRDANGYTGIRHWPSVCLTSIVRSTAKATMSIEGVDNEVDGDLLIVDEVYLTLGWDLESRVIAWLQFLPALAANPHRTFPGAPWLEFDYSTFSHYFEVHEQGRVGEVRYRLKEGEKLSFEIETDGKKWPDGASPTQSRFERLTAATLSRTFIEGRALATPHQRLCTYVDTTDVIAPPSSTLALIEAVLLGHNSRRKEPIFSFLDSLEEEIKKYTISFREWKAKSIRRAIQKHVRIRAEMLLDVEKLQGEPLHKTEKEI